MASFTKIYWLSHLGSWSSVSVSVGGLYISSEAERRYWTKVPSWCDVAGSFGVSATRSTWGSSARCCSQTSPGSSRPRCRSLAWPLHIHNIYIYTSIPESISISIHLFQNLIRTDYFESVLSVLCVSEVIVRYFHLTTFFWMFLEGKLVHAKFLPIIIYLNVRFYQVVEFKMLNCSLKDCTCFYKFSSPSLSPLSDTLTSSPRAGVM